MYTKIRGEVSHHRQMWGEEQDDGGGDKGLSSDELH